MSGMTLASRTFVPDDQALFAGLTGDFNPIHLDPIAARRTQAGAVVVHGIHAILWALDKLVELGGITKEIASLKVQFTNFIYVGGQVDLKLLHRDEKSARAELSVGKLTTANLLVTFGTRSGVKDIEAPIAGPTMKAPNEPASFTRLEEIERLSGRMNIIEAADEIEKQFPHASSAIGRSRVTAIALLSRLVGMICPGLHSLFAGFAVELAGESRYRHQLTFQVSTTDERFRMVRISVSGAGIFGSIQAFMRWPPIEQASLSEIRAVVGPAEFSGSTALIIGGSRGLGALTAKILAVGGSKVIVTYARGKADAEDLTKEIQSQTASDRCRSVRYDINEDAADQLRDLGASLTHLYYFATGSITRQKQSPFDTSLFEEFVEMYVKGFYDCCRSIYENTSQALTAFYPSSVFVESNPPAMIEYSMAKMAGETLCTNLNRVVGNRVHIMVSRLPRLLTDQSATVLPLERADPLKVMLPLIRSVQMSSEAHKMSGGAGGGV